MFILLESWNILSHVEFILGDSNATLPVFNLGEFTVKQIRDHTKKIRLSSKYSWFN
jgi:hypothetical protein